MSQRYAVCIRRDNGIAQAMEKYCNEKGLSINGFMVRAVKEKLAKMDVHTLTINEIEKLESDYNEFGRYV